MSGYRRVQAAADELAPHCARTDTNHTISCEQAALADWTTDSADHPHRGLARDQTQRPWRHRLAASP